VNAPFDQALLNADCAQHSTGSVDAASVRPDSIRASSRPLGWKQLNIERRELEPGGDCLPGGSTEHLMSLEPGYLNKIARESFGFDAAEVRLTSIWCRYDSTAPVHC
jgi:hypothetical protein